MKTRLLAALALVCVASIPAHAETGVASHYGHHDGYNGRRTADGEIFDTYRHMTAAMRKPQPFGSYVTVTNLGIGRSVMVRLNDRGPISCAGGALPIQSG
jgi:rare lipoprotein A